MDAMHTEYMGTCAPAPADPSSVMSTGAQSRPMRRSRRPMGPF